MDATFIIRLLAMFVMGAGGAIIGCGVGMFLTTFK